MTEYILTSYRNPLNRILFYASPISCPGGPLSPVIIPTIVYQMIAKQQVSFTNLVLPNNWIGQFALWKAVQEEPELMTSFSSIVTIWNNGSNQQVFIPNFT
jgi:hypothetical protein